MRFIFSFVAVLLCAFGGVQVAWAWKLEADTFTTANTFAAPVGFDLLNFRQTYDTVPMVFFLANQSGGDPSTIMMAGTTTTGTYMQITEPEGRDGPHIPNTASYFAAEPGVHQLPDGSFIEVGFIDTQAYQGRNVTGTSWQNVNFSHTFASPPVVLTQKQTLNNEELLTAQPGSYSPFPRSQPFLTTVSQNITATGMQVALDYSDTDAGSITQNERIAYVAIGNASGATLTDNAANTIAYDAFANTGGVDGWSNGCDIVAFPTVNNGAAISVASKNSRNETDGGWLRSCSDPANGVGLTFDEDTAAEGERSHGSETIGVLAFSQAFDAEIINEVDLVLSKIADDTTPDEGQLVDYTISVTNNGPSLATNVVVSDTLPGGLTYISSTPSQGSVTP